MDNSQNEKQEESYMSESFLRDRAETLQILHEMEIATEVQIALEEIEKREIEKGEKIGMEKGERIGIAKATKKIAIRMHNNGLSLDFISNMVNMPIDELKILLEIE